MDDRASVVNSPRRGIGQTSLSRVVAHAASLDVSVWETAAAPERIPGLGAAAVKALRRFILMQKTLEQMGIEPGRLKLIWASAAEGAKFTDEVIKIVEEVRLLGPLNWPAGQEMEKLPESMLTAQAAD